MGPSEIVFERLTKMEQDGSQVAFGSKRGQMVTAGMPNAAFPRLHDKSRRPA